MATLHRRRVRRWLRLTFDRSLSKREYCLLAATVPGLRASFEQVMAGRGLRAIDKPAPPS